jgi:16S rRNA C967 or C1407 C5-methylase (RsmB/RsmF family)/NOL1/NOP2/fmu family ribosome biogenesis protein
MAAMLGEELPSFLEALLAPGVALRVNPLRLSAERFETISPFPVEPLPFPQGAYAVPAGTRPGRHPFHAAGLYYVQDPGAMVVGALVGARAGERVLDLSAAPGGKTTLMAGMMGNAGVLVANDVSRTRARELVGNLERCGVTNAVVTVETPERLAARFGAWFDRVLVDAPCSGESMFARSEAARAEWSPGVVAGCARRQSELLATACALVRPGGVLVYSTCTFSREENEDVVSAFLDARPDFGPEPLTPVAGTERVGDPTFTAYRLWPHRMPGAGHFVAAFRRIGGEEPSLESRRIRRLPDTFIRPAQEFIDAVFPGEEFPIGRLEARGSVLFALPDGMPESGGTNVLWPGVELGSIRNGRFEPAHALVMSIPPAKAAGSIDIPLESSDLLRYLRGETIDVEGPSGWWPVTVDGFSLGWGKRTGSTVKNHYPKGLRWRG